MFAVIFAMFIFAKIIFAMLEPTMSSRWRWSNEAIADAVVKHTHARHLNFNINMLRMRIKNTQTRRIQNMGSEWKWSALSRQCCCNNCNGSMAEMQLNSLQRGSRSKNHTECNAPSSVSTVSPFSNTNTDNTFNTNTFIECTYRYMLI